MDSQPIPPAQSAQSDRSQPANPATLTEMEARIMALESDLQKQGRTLRTILIISSLGCILNLLKLFIPVPLTSFGNIITQVPVTSVNHVNPAPQ
jgi:hypothetical protein